MELRTAASDPHATPAEGYTVVAGVRTPGRWASLWRFRGLLGSFMLRELQVRYRQAALGFLWALLQPVALALITTLVFHEALHISVGDLPYGLFVYTGLLAWTYFHAAVTGAVPTLVNNAGLIRKIWFPREALPLATVLAVGLDLGFGTLLWLALLAFYGFGFSFLLLWAVPLLAILVAVTAAVALAGAAINVRFRDVKYALPLLLQVLFFATPIVYPASAVPARWRPVLDLNPLSCVVTGMREIGLHGAAPDPARTLLGALGALVFLVLAWLLFLRSERRFADII